MQRLALVASLCALCLAANVQAFTSPIPFTAAKSSRLSLRSNSAVSMKVDLLQKVESLKVLTAVSKAGLLSKIEKSGLLSKLEQQGALSQVEKLLPLLDDYQAISLLNKIVNIEPITLSLLGTGILFADGILIAAVPDSDGTLIALQAVATLLAIATATPLFIGAQINTIIQGNTPIGK